MIVYRQKISHLNQKIFPSLWSRIDASFLRSILESIAIDDGAFCWYSRINSDRNSVTAGTLAPYKAIDNALLLVFSHLQRSKFHYCWYSRIYSDPVRQETEVSLALLYSFFHTAYSQIRPYPLLYDGGGIKRWLVLLAISWMASKTTPLPCTE